MIYLAPTFEKGIRFCQPPPDDFGQETPCMPENHAKNLDIVLKSVLKQLAQENKSNHHCYSAIS